ncbi:16S rRNA (cytidine(1402)-2'-O)-methyltransferase [uncultured Tateyamaria sp.]|uniref:16S rRNA (cytidine(1402)-2'-O)-methyltransferase n=1 Tax=uncultured Tateyamaria sp. TaxID=455651 RepID=UPI002622C07C|nr:16S rRNA (cytidine(1402)-2'-O)-methyltransferase [uncultured Tateyamaria sp.]
MNHVKLALSPGIWFVGVPIGTARDITLRALDVLASADVLVAEDTRSLRKLMDIHGVPLDGRRIEALHDHSGPGSVDRLVARAAGGESVAYASEAGMPLIADPGFELGRAARAADVAVTCAPGPSAVLTALVVGGLPTDAFHFGGFLPNARGARQTALRALVGVQATLVLYESPKRVGALLRDASEVLGSDRPAVVCRELTKKFEEKRHGTLGELAEIYDGLSVKGEVVVLIGRREVEEIKETDIESALESALQDMSVKDAAAFVADTFGLSKRKIYQQALDVARRN